MAESVEALGLPFVEVEVAFQLNIEDAVLISRFDIVVFVDASVSASEPYSFVRITPDEEISFTTHSLSPGSVLAICDDHFGPVPEAWQLAIRGSEFEFQEGLTEKAAHNLEEAVAFLSTVLHRRRKAGSGPLYVEPNAK